MKFNFYALKIVVICVVIFAIQIIFPSFENYFVLNSSSYTEVWRFMTAIFLHGDIQHLLYNMFALAMFGSILERLIGGRRFLMVYLVSGIVANIIAVNFYTSSLGASGAIYGILGALILIRPAMIVFAFGLSLPMVIAGIAWAVGDVIGLFTPSNVGHIAHLSGMMMGIIFGFIYRNHFKEDRRVVGGIILDENKMRDWEDAYLK